MAVHDAYELYCTTKFAELLAQYYNTLMITIDTNTLWEACSKWSIAYGDRYAKIRWYYDWKQLLIKVLSQWLKTVFGKTISFADLFKKSQLLLYLLWLVTSWSRFEGYLWHLYRQTGFLIFWIEFATTEHARVNWIQPCAILCTKSLYRHLRVYGLSLNYYNISLIHCQMTIPIYQI